MATMNLSGRTNSTETLPAPSLSKTRVMALYKEEFNDAILHMASNNLLAQHQSEVDSLLGDLSSGFDKLVPENGVSSVSQSKEIMKSFTARVLSRVKPEIFKLSQDLLRATNNCFTTFKSAYEGLVDEASLPETYDVETGPKTYNRVTKYLEEVQGVKGVPNQQDFLKTHFEHYALYLADGFVEEEAMRLLLFHLDEYQFSKEEVETLYHCLPDYFAALFEVAATKHSRTRQFEHFANDITKQLDGGHCAATLTSLTLRTEEAKQKLVALLATFTREWLGRTTSSLETFFEELIENGKEFDTLGEEGILDHMIECGGLFEQALEGVEENEESADEDASAVEATKTEETPKENKEETPVPPMVEEVVEEIIEEAPVVADVPAPAPVEAVVGVVETPQDPEPLPEVPQEEAPVVEEIVEVVATRDCEPVASHTLDFAQSPETLSDDLMAEVQQVLNMQHAAHVSEISTMQERIKTLENLFVQSKDRLATLTGQVGKLSETNKSLSDSFTTGIERVKQDLIRFEQGIAQARQQFETDRTAFIDEYTQEFNTLESVVTARLKRVNELASGLQQRIEFLMGAIAENSKLGAHLQDRVNTLSQQIATRPAVQEIVREVPVARPAEVVNEGPSDVPAWLLDKFREGLLNETVEKYAADLEFLRSPKNREFAQELETLEQELQELKLQIGACSSEIAEIAGKQNSDRSIFKNELQAFTEDPDDEFVVTLSRFFAALDQHDDLKAQYNELVNKLHAILDIKAQVLIRKFTPLKRSLSLHSLNQIFPNFDIAELLPETFNTYFANDIFPLLRETDAFLDQYTNPEYGKNSTLKQRFSSAPAPYKDNDVLTTMKWISGRVNFRGKERAKREKDTFTPLLEQARKVLNELARPQNTLEIEPLEDLSQEQATILVSQVIWELAGKPKSTGGGRIGKGPRINDVLSALNNIGALVDDEDEIKDLLGDAHGRFRETFSTTPRKAVFTDFQTENPHARFVEWKYKASRSRGSDTHFNLLPDTIAWLEGLETKGRLCSDTKLSLETARIRKDMGK